MDIADWVKRNRTTCGWTQLELAMRLGVYHGCVSRWERGIHLPDLAQFRELCVAFRASADVALALKTPAKRSRGEARA